MKIVGFYTILAFVSISLVAISTMIVDDILPKAHELIPTAKIILGNFNY